MLDPEIDARAGCKALQIDAGSDREVHGHGRPAERRNRPVAHIHRTGRGIDGIDGAGALRLTVSGMGVLGPALRAA